MEGSIERKEREVEADKAFLVELQGMENVYKQIIESAERIREAKRVSLFTDLDARREHYNARKDKRQRTN